MIFSIPIILDGILALMLAATIFCCSILFQRLVVIRKSQSDMRSVIADFNSATERAQTGLLSLKTSGKELTQSMEEKINEAKALNDDLRFLTEVGSRMADRLDKIVGNTESSEGITLLANKKQVNNDHSKARSESELALMAALEQSR
tara:strand:- start:2047 stop:2487 length:441 start_codon:yes stop_codon:yes gene_type:complete